MAKRCLTILLILCFLLGGCTPRQDVPESKPAEETEKTPQEGPKALLKVGEEALPLKLAQLCAVSQKQQYETAFGSSIWEVEYQGRSFEDMLKDNFRTHVTLMFTSDCMAKSEGVTLSAEE